MAYLKFIGLLLLFTGSCWAQCSGRTRPHAHLQWSEPVRVVAPDRAWVVEVHPILDADENRTPVTLHKCGESKSWPLFTLRRDADVYWSSDSKQLLVIDQPLSGGNKVLLFTVPKTGTEIAKAESDALDKAVRAVISEHVGEGKHITFYLPALASWKDRALLLAVGGEAYAGNGGPLDSYCYGLTINSDSLHVGEVLSEKQLKARTGRSCQVSP